MCQSQLFTLLAATHDFRHIVFSLPSFLVLVLRSLSLNKYRKNKWNFFTLVSKHFCIRQVWFKRQKVHENRDSCTCVPGMMWWSVNETAESGANAVWLWMYSMLLWDRVWLEHKTQTFSWRENVHFLQISFSRSNKVRFLSSRAETVHRD